MGAGRRPRRSLMTRSHILNLSRVAGEFVHFPRPLPSPRILKAEGLGLVVVSKGFRKASPGHDRAQCLLRRVSRHVVFELIEKPASWCDVICAFLQHTSDMGGKRNVGQQLLLEEFFSIVQRSARELLAHIGKPNIAFFDLRQSQHLQCLGDRKQVVHFHVK
jgi:hypothetical protein